MANINKIRLSGQTYDIQDSGAQRTLSAGVGIDITDNVISATGGGGSSYTAGDGIDITNDVISVTGKTDTTTYNTYTAATNSRLSEDEEVTAAAFNSINDRLSEDEEVTAAGLNALNESLNGKADTTAFTAHTADTTIHVTSSDKSSWNGAATNASNAVTALGGLKLQQITQSAYDALVTKDSSTLYIIVN